jgi:hypothetical protein
MRERIARYLVKEVAGLIDIAFAWNRAATMLVEAKPNDGEPSDERIAKHFEMLYLEEAKRNDWKRKLAIKIHKEGAVDEMVNAGWWG